MALASLVGRGGGKGGWNYKWQYDTLTPHLATFNARFEAATAALMERFAGELQDYAQENATWEDRTGAAREGLTANASHSLFHHTITLYHTVDYGIWLEVRWAGQYAIILPTIEHMGPQLMSELTLAMAAASGGHFL